MIRHGGHFPSPRTHLEAMEVEETRLVLCRLHMAKSGVSSYGIREKWEEAVSTAHAEVKVFFTFSPSQSSPFVYLKVSTSLQPKPSFPPTSPPPSTQRYFHYYQSLLHYNVPLCFSNNICVPSFPLPPHPLLPHTHSVLPLFLPTHSLFTPSTSSPPYPSPSTT